MTPAQLDALLAYIDARIAETHMPPGRYLDDQRKLDETALRDAFKEEGERDE